MGSAWLPLLDPLGLGKGCHTTVESNSRRPGPGDNLEADPCLTLEAGGSRGRLSPGPCCGSPTFPSPSYPALLLATMISSV